MDTVRALQDFEGGRDTDDLMTCVLNFTYETLPDPPVTPDTPLTIIGAAWSGSPGDGVDHINNLPDQIMCNVVSHLPTKDAARTCALERHVPLGAPHLHRHPPPPQVSGGATLAVGP
jgi:hypothetical protein